MQMIILHVYWSQGFCAVHDHWQARWHSIFGVKSFFLYVQNTCSAIRCTHIVYMDLMLTFISVYSFGPFDIISSSSLIRELLYYKVVILKCSIRSHLCGCGCGCKSQNENENESSHFMLLVSSSLCHENVVFESPQQKRTRYVYTRRHTALVAIVAAVAATVGIMNICPLAHFTI